MKEEGEIRVVYEGWYMKEEGEIRVVYEGGI